MLTGMSIKPDHPVNRLKMYPEFRLNRYSWLRFIFIKSFFRRADVPEQNQKPARSAAGVGLAAAG